MIGIYKITSPSGKIYIGQSINIEKRKKQYEGHHCKKQQKLYASLNKYGFVNHSFEIIEECAEDIINEREEFWINKYDTWNTIHGLNLQSGGLNKRVSEETKLKISFANTGNKRPDMVERMKNRIYVCSDATKKIISENRKKMRHTEKTKQKLRELNLGKKMSDESKIKMSIAKKGKKQNPTAIQNAVNARLISENVGKKVINTDTGVVYRNLLSMCRELGLNYGTMKPKMRGVRKNNTPYKYL